MVSRRALFDELTIHGSDPSRLLAFSTTFVASFKDRVAAVVDKKIRRAIDVHVVAAMRWHHKHKTVSTSPAKWASFVNAIAGFCRNQMWTVVPVNYRWRVLRERSLQARCVVEAARLGAVEMMASILNPFAPFNDLFRQRDRNGNTAVHIAARFGHIEVLNYSLGHGSLTKSKSSRMTLPQAADHPFNKRGQCGYTPLLAAIQGGQREVVEYFVEQGVKLDLKDSCGRNALHVAVRHRQHKLIPLLCCLGFDANCRLPQGGATAVHCAVQQSDVPSLKLLLEHAPGSSYEVLAVDAEALLRQALKANQPRMFTFLLHTSGRYEILDGAHDPDLTPSWCQKLMAERMSSE